MSLIVPSWYNGQIARGLGDAANPSLRRGLVGAWYPGLGPTGDTLYDVSGYKNHGTLTNMDPATDWVVGQDGYALDFADGVNQYVDSSMDQFESISCVFLMALRATPGPSRHIIGQFDAASDGWELAVDSSRNLWYAHSYNWAVNNTSYTFTLGRWVSIGFVFDKAIGATLYANGIVIASDSGSGSLAVSSNFRIGVRSGGGLDPPTMSLGNCCVYNRALQPDEITQLYVDPYAPIRRRRRVVVNIPAEVAGGSESFSFPPSFGTGFMHGAF